jgi:hypothetical protein
MTIRYLVTSFLNPVNRHFELPTSAGTAKKCNDVSLHLLRKCDLHNSFLRLVPLSPFSNLRLVNCQKIYGGISAMRLTPFLSLLILIRFIRFRIFLVLFIQWSLFSRQLPKKEDGILLPKSY